jgi:sulfite exporter TauE/SafE
MIGMVGSFHCVGMCGPIALALPMKGKSKFPKLLGSLVYNTGRLFTYALLGCIFGTLGTFFFMAGLQQTLSISLGILIIGLIIIPHHLQQKLSPVHFLSKTIASIRKPLQQLFATPSYPARLMIGMLNGLLPCGLVYMGIAGAIATGSVMKGSLFMLFFGLGTFPAMLGVSLLGHWIGIKTRNRIRAAVPVLVVLMGFLFILRGLGLGIPYLSPLLMETSIPLCE